MNFIDELVAAFPARNPVPSVLHTLRQSTIDQQGGAGDETRDGARQEDRGVRDLLGRGNAPYGVLPDIDVCKPAARYF
ncbi:hypothetical protein ACVW0A_005707 [Pseudomonas sp. TE3610]